MPRLKDRATFLLERLLLRGAHYRLLVIAALIGLVSVVAGVLVLLGGGEFAGPGDAIWWAFLRLTDPGYLGDDQGVLLRTVSTILTVLGYVIFLGALIAIMTQWLNQTLRNLESGLTPIAQNDHILILGWTNRTATIVRELVLSEGRVRRFLRRHGARRLRIVILVEQLSAALVNELRERLGPLWDERQITFRSGSPLRIEHLQRVDFMNAAAIILPGADFAGGEAAYPDRTTDASATGGRSGASSTAPTAPPPISTDTRAIKTLLSITNHPSARVEDVELPLVVTEIFDARKVTVARGAYGGKIEILTSDSMISRLIAQNVRHQGLSDVYGELLSHGRGNEVYIRECPQFAGVPLQDLTEVFRNSVVLGVVRRHGGSYRPILNPPDGFAIEAEDRLVLLARSYDDSAPAAEIRPLPSPRGAPPGGEGGAAPHRRILLLGWSHKVPALLQEFGSYAGESFDIDILSVVPIARRTARLERYDFRPERLRVRHLEGDYTVPSELARTDPAAYDNVVLLGSDWLRSGEESDARSIVGYLLLRELLPADGPKPALLVELLDPANLSLFHRRAGEVLISPSILSHILAQVALRRELRAVFDQLFGSAGAEIRFRPMSWYGTAGEEVSFRDLQRLAASHGETALGVRTGGGTRRGGVLLNPSREQRWIAGESDDLVVLTAHE
jgi:hypothetical protein